MGEVYLKNHKSKFRQIFCTLPVAVARSSSDGNAMLYTSRIVNDALFSRNGANGSESRASRMFRPVRKVAVLWAMFAVFDCTLSSDVSVIGFQSPCFQNGAI